MADDNNQTDLNRVHKRLDELFAKTGEIAATVKGIEERCGPCSKMVADHQETLHGNGKDGLIVKVATATVGRTDTLSVKGVCALVGAIGTLAATIGAAMAVFAR